MNASSVCPVKVLPLASVIVPDAITGSLIPFSSNTESIANNAALQFRTSNIVSTRRICTPPSISPLACSEYASTSSSKDIALAPGSFTSDDIDAVRFVGPSVPAIKCASGSMEFSNSVIASAARCAE